MQEEIRKWKSVCVYAQVSACMRALQEGKKKDEWRLY